MFIFFSSCFWLAFKMALNLMVHSEVLCCSYGCYCLWILSIFWTKKILYLPRMWFYEHVCRSIVIPTATGNGNQNVLGLWVMHILCFFYCVVKGLGLMNLLAFSTAVGFQWFISQHPWRGGGESTNTAIIKLLEEIEVKNKDTQEKKTVWGYCVHSILVSRWGWYGSRRWT